MSVVESETAEKSPEGSPPPFVESETAETLLPYDKGGVPIYVAVAWVGIIIAYVTGVLTLVIPDLRAWMAR
jgi:hypothetical protein